MSRLSPLVGGQSRQGLQVDRAALDPMVMYEVELNTEYARCGTRRIQDQGGVSQRGAKVAWELG